MDTLRGYKSAVSTSFANQLGPTIVIITFLCHDAMKNFFQVTILGTLYPKNKVHFSVEEIENLFDKLGVKNKKVRGTLNTFYFKNPSVNLRDTISWSVIVHSLLNANCSDYSCSKEHCLTCSFSSFIKSVCEKEDLTECKDSNKFFSILNYNETEVTNTFTLHPKFPPPAEPG
jgi:hypothetical protein